MMTNNKMSCWYALHTAPKYERKLMQRLNAAGYTTFCPMRIVFRKWNGRVREVFVPLFPGCLFVEEAAGLTSFVASQKASILIDEKGNKVSILADYAELSSKFVQL